MRSFKLVDSLGAGIRQEDLPSSEDGYIDLKSWFGEERKNLPLDLEIGAGKGAFIISAGKKYEDVNFIAIEYAGKYWKLIVKRCNSHMLHNVKVLRVEAASFIKDYVSDETFREIHIYFPDPWHKRKHNRRRLLQDSFFKELHRIVKPGGYINILTDQSDYFNWITKHLKNVSNLFEQFPFKTPEFAEEGELVGTNFERKYRKEGREFYGISLKK